MWMKEFHLGTYTDDLAKHNERNYSFDIMYNTTLSVNISAHNCAGYSDPFPLEIEYEQGWDRNEACAAMQ